MHHIEIPFATAAEVVVARGYLRACVEQNPLWEPEHTEEINALDHDTVVERTLRLWPEGWRDFCVFFAGDIRIAEEDETAHPATDEEDDTGVESVRSCGHAREAWWDDCPF
ncbi:hypothetical protein [Nocardia vinacea]|uniref:hypothetical protein n=1 Tax=Nocardia vinacea TaxID=96468 RepID=UPI0002E4BF98|nr:hypothetical protein [Nocardia vinacea]